MRSFLLFVSIVIAGCSGIEAKYQNDMDKQRIADVDYLETLFLEYRSKAGVLPLQNKIVDKTIQVFITHRRVPTWMTTQAQKLPLESFSTPQLRDELTAVLGRDIELPSDPQNVSTFAPNLYIYMVSKDQACVAGHLYSATPDTRNVQNRYHKYEKCIGIQDKQLSV